MARLQVALEVSILIPLPSCHQHLTEFPAESSAPRCSDCPAPRPMRPPAGEHDTFGRQESRILFIQCSFIITEFQTSKGPKNMVERRVRRIPSWEFTPQTALASSTSSITTALQLCQVSLGITKSSGDLISGRGQVYGNPRPSNFGGNILKPHTIVLN